MAFEVETKAREGEGRHSRKVGGYKRLCDVI